MAEGVLLPGEALRLRRKALGLSVRGVAKKAGVSYALIGALERDEVDLRKSRTATIHGLLQALSWTPEEFTIATGIQLPGITTDVRTGKLEILTAEELEEFKAVNRDLERLEEFTGGDLLKRIQGAKKSIGRLLKMISRGVLA